LFVAATTRTLTLIALLQHAQDLGLRGGRHVADLVEEDGAAVALLELAQALRGRAGERAALVPEELAFDEILRDRRAVDRDVGLGRAMAVAVQAARHEFLAGAALAGDHHRGVAGGELADDLEDLLHGRRGADDALLVLLRVDDRLVAGRGLAVGLGAQGAFDQGEQLGRIEGFNHVVEGAELHRLDGGLRGAEGRHEDHQLLRVGRADVLERLQARHAGHAVVEQHDIGRLFLDGGHAFLTARGLLHLVVLRRKHAVQRVANFGVVIDDENAGDCGGFGHQAVWKIKCALGKDGSTYPPCLGGQLTCFASSASSCRCM
jgi:hypothetical protein